jgi:hypothetical protein
LIFDTDLCSVCLTEDAWLGSLTCAQRFSKVGQGLLIHNSQVTDITPETWENEEFECINGPSRRPHLIPEVPRTYRKLVQQHLVVGPEKGLIGEDLELFWAFGISNTKTSNSWHSAA